MLPATRGAEVLYHNVLNPVLSNVKARAQGGSTTSNNPFNKNEGFNMAGTTAPSSFEREFRRSRQPNHWSWACLSSEADMP
jgi:receptor expression-enhancing protein 5/6